MLISILGVALSVSFSTPTIASSLASEHQLLPRMLGRQNKRGVPIVSLLLSCGLCALMLFSGNYLFLASAIVFTSFIQYVPTILAAIKLRNHSKLPQGFRLCGGNLIPIIALLVTLYLILSFSLELIVAGVLVFLLSAVWYFYDDRDRQANGLRRDIVEGDKAF